MADDSARDTAARPGYYARLGDYAIALNALLARSGPGNEPPGLVEAIARGESWADVEIEKMWVSLRAAARAHPGDRMPTGEENRFDPVAWTDLAGPLKRSLYILIGLYDRWKPGDPERKKVEISGGRCRRGDNKEWVPIAPPIMTLEEYEALQWVFQTTEKVLSWVGEPIPWGDEGERGAPPLRIVRGEGDVGQTVGGGTSEADLVMELRELGRPTQANLVDFMAGHDSATFTKASDAIYGDPFAKQDRFRKTVERVNGFLELKGSKLRYSIASDRIFKHDSVE